MTAYELDYNDQCDLVYGRLCRLSAANPEVLKASVGQLKELGLILKGLGVSGAQVEMAFGKLKSDNMEEVKSNE